MAPEHPGSFAATSEKTTSFPLRQRVSDAILARVAPLGERLVQGYRAVSGGFMVKRPGGADVRLHRHGALLDESRHAALLVWVPLQDTSRETGCMVVVPGTHRVRSLTGLEMEEPPEAREIPLEAGQALVMDHRLVHGSRPNPTAEERLAVAVLFVPVDAPLWYCHRSERTMDIFQVPDDFYRRWLPGAPPPLETAPILRLPLR